MRVFPRRILILSFFATLPSLGLCAVGSGAMPITQRSQWNGFERLDFNVEGRPAILVRPVAPADGRPWIWRTDVFGERPQVDVELLKRGWHVAYIDAPDRYGGPKAMSLYGQFYVYLVVNQVLARRVVMEGFGRGGLAAFNFAATHPTRVAAVYLDAPALDIKSWPGPSRPKEWAECLEAYGLSPQTLAAFRGNPVDRAPIVAKGGVPVIIVTGNADNTVPYEENTAVLEKRFREAGGTIEVIVKPGADHRPFSLEDPARIVDFILRNAKF